MVEFMISSNLGGYHGRAGKGSNFLFLHGYNEYPTCPLIRTSKPSYFANRIDIKTTTEQQTFLEPVVAKQEEPSSQNTSTGFLPKITERVYLLKASCTKAEIFRRQMS